MGCLVPKCSDVGIDRIAVWPCTLSTDMPALAKARGGTAETVVGQMLTLERALNPAWEDPVTMAVNAADSLLIDEDRSQIKLLLVASESSLDREKSLSSWIHYWLDLPDDCRNLEVKSACYAGSGSLELACHWLLTQPEGVKALVIGTDESRQHFNKPHEFVMGAGSAAMLLSRKPRLLAMDLGLSGVYAHEVADLIRPTSRVETGHSEMSLLSYLDAVDITFERYRTAWERSGGPALDTLDKVREHLIGQVYHCPFAGIVERAHRSLFRSLEGFDAQETRRDYEKRILPTLRFNRRLGSTYASSVFITLLALAEHSHASQRVGIYSYGSGSCAEYYSGVFMPEAAPIALAEGLQSKLDARLAVDVRGYEEAERERTAFVDCSDYRVSIDGHDNWFDRRYKGQGLLTYRGTEEFVRLYERS